VVAESKALHSGLRLAQRYQLTEHLADGAVCAIYRGQDLVLRRPIAVKTVPPEWAAVYEAALRATAVLSHPAVVCVYDALDHDGWLFVVQEYVAGRPLSAYFPHGVPVERAVDLGGQLARALSYAHVHGVVHGDLTPAAVLVDRNAVVRINNFGLPPDTAYFASLADAVATSLGALTFAPGAGVQDMQEAQGGRALASPAGDTRALGYLLWHLLSVPEPASDVPGGMPADGAEMHRRFRAEVSEGLRDLVTRCVAVTEEPIEDPTTLAQTLEELGAELAARHPTVAVATPPAVLAARAAAVQAAAWSEEATIGSGRQSWSGGADPGERTVPDGTRVVASGRASSLAADQPSPLRPHARGSGTPDVPRWSFPGADALDSDQGRVGFPLVIVLLLGGVLFVLFFLVGYYSSIWSR
jgi:serine/threonine-protein kinase